MSDEECPGEGKCHGCLSWCDSCGDVGAICDGEEHGYNCDEHYCTGCSKPRPDKDEDYRDWKWTCESCAKQAELERLERDLLWAASNDDPRNAQWTQRIVDRMRALSESP